MRRCHLVVIGSLLACGEDPPSSQGSSSSGSDGGSTTSGSVESSSTGAPQSSSSGGADSSGSSSGGTTGELPDYTDSPCWGMPATTLVYDGQTHQTVEVPATCRAEGDRAFVIVADTLWENGIDQAAVNGFMHRYELFTPEGAFDPSQGVIRNDEAVFGSLDAAQLPGGKVSIFVVDTNGGGDGYLCGWCDYPQLHLDGTVLTPLDGDDALSIAAHESYHIIHYGYDADEEPWVDESLAQAAMTANGFFTDDEWLDDFRLDPDQDWGPGGVDFGSFNYGAGLIWGSYLYERGGAALMTAITAETANDWAGLDAALASVGEPDAWSVFLDMGVAMIADRPELGYGIEAFDVGEVGREGDLAAGDGASGGVFAGGFDVYRLVGPGPLDVTVGGTGVAARAFRIADDIVVIDPVGGATLELDAQDDAFVFVTAQQNASYTIDVQ
ncbi:MAG: hypothetical protein K1X88_16205 [Nannocystaceae bacterium]|nr:hypothetical protein [Nannocystaceae bacterium]